MTEQTKDIGNKTVPQVRKHYYLDQYVVIAPRRSKRPRQEDTRATISQKTEPEHSIEDTPSIYEYPSGGNEAWSVKVVPNAYPAFASDNQYARGRQEIVLETPRASTPFYALSVEEIERVFSAYQRRVSELGREYPYVSVFKNQGQAAGATLDHTHSQIIAADIVPPDVVRDRDALTQYQYMHRTSAVCDVIRRELADNTRIVAPTRHTTTLCPYASRFPLEAWIIPHRQSHSITDLSEEEIHSLADHLKGVTVALADSGIDFNYYLMESIPGYYNHFYIKVVPRISPRGGFELDTGMYINPVSPEYAAQWYQKHIKVPHETL